MNIISDQSSEPSLGLPDDRLLTQERCNAVWKHVKAASVGEGRTAIKLTSFWNGELRWARNRVYLASNRRNIRLEITRVVGGARGWAAINQLDPEALTNGVRQAEAEAFRNQFRFAGDMKIAQPNESMPTPTIWSDATVNTPATERGKLAAMLSRDAEAQGLLAAGYLEVRGASRAYAGMGDEEGTILLGLDREWREENYDPSIHDTLRYHQMTQAQCSMTIRHPKGVGSGWAGLSSYDWTKVNPEALAKTALDKCVASLNPVRIEPGRYTVILEPQAVCELVDLFMDAPAISRTTTELMGRGPFLLGADQSLNLWRTKIGLKVLDERITIVSEPMDPQLGSLPKPGLKSVTWIDRGVLTAMSYDRPYGKEYFKEEQGVIHPGTYRMSGGMTTIEEMIATTKRGLLVSRFSNLDMLDWMSVLATGFTRDGLWLIENGKITKAVNNMRFTESPIFVLNQIEQLGVPQPVFRPNKRWMAVQIRPAIVPPIKSRDFSFTSTIDAI